MRNLIVLMSFLFVPLAFAGGITEKVIMPVSGQGVPGENASIWKIVVVGYNPTALQVPIHLSSPYTCVTCYAPLDPLQAHETHTFEPTAPQPAMGIFMYVGDTTDPQAVGQVTLTARVQDISRQAQTWGTKIPIVREKDLLTGTLSLINVPTDDRFRQALRIYDYDNNESSVRIRVVNEATNALVVTQELTLSAGFYPAGSVPAQVAINNLLAAFPAIPANTTVRIEVEPVTPKMRFWAFMSITNNVTQHVTVITPY